MTLTTFLAVWGAVVSTLVAIWNIYKDFIKRDQVRVTAGFRILFPQNIEVLSLTITNLTSHKVKVTHIGGYHDRRYSPPWLDQLVARFVTRSKQAFLLSFEPYQSQRIPFSIDPWDYTIVTYKPEVLPTIETLMVTTADGREWYCPRRDIEALHADATYKKIRQDPPQPTAAKSE